MSTHSSRRQLQTILASQILLSFLSFTVRALSLSRTTQDVISPPILEPNASSIWTIGSQQIVTWNTTGIPSNPSEITNTIGEIVLGFNSSDGENLDLNNTLAQGFLLTDGNVSITVPNVTVGNNYIIALIGDSGNTSPPFTITSDPATSLSSTTLAASTSVGADADTVPSTGTTTAGSTGADTTAAPSPTGTTV